MKKLILGLVFTAMSLSAFAADDTTNLQKLDVLKTCVSSEQKTAGEKVLNFMFSFRWWQIKSMMDSMHPEYVHWHGSRVYVAVVTPEDKWPSLPYRKGIISKDVFLEDLAMVAYTNDVPKYIVDITRAECVGNDTVILSSNFNGVNVVRDAQGYVTHNIPLENLPVRFMITVKDGLIYRNLMEIPETATLEIFKKMKEAMKSPALPRDENTRTTYQEILARFKKEAAGQ